ncbi:hypothetical protein CPB84DRAFT_836414 [Gymnopilus junonius]|uniref:Secreted protein n=1 Tax=Gymnopilus junonius TaxID=109634 RepID=A0A9P5NSB5_GYMJU|nr:hypothetical protein CPB84DRAFT_836414 [Gymnopilus junonius]
MFITLIILLITAHLNLLEPPLRQNTIRRSQITPQRLMPQPQSRRQRVYATHIPALPPALHVIHHFHPPMIVMVPNRLVPITRHLVIQLRHGRQHRVRVQIPRGGTCRRMMVSPCLRYRSSGEVGCKAARSIEAGPSIRCCCLCSGSTSLVAGLSPPGMFARASAAARRPAHVFQCDFGSIGDFWRGDEGREWSVWVWKRG